MRDCGQLRYSRRCKILEKINGNLASRFINYGQLKHDRKFLAAIFGVEKMKDNYDKCLAHVLKSEGGYVNNKHDRGGETMRGVTRAVWEQWLGRDVQDGEMINLTVEDVAPLYRKEYWDRLRLDDCPAGLDMVLMDIGVNSGTGRAAKWVQRIAGVKVDGAIGPVTMRGINDLDPVETIKQIKHVRQKFYERLKSFEHFGRGWTARNKDVTEYALSMAR